MRIRVAVVFLALFFAISYPYALSAAGMPNSPQSAKSQNCPTTPKACPDGSQVFKTGANCTYPSCPEKKKKCTLMIQYCPDGSKIYPDAQTCTYTHKCSKKKDTGNVCPQDSKICANGATVPRTGKRCKFVCPEAEYK